MLSRQKLETTSSHTIKKKRRFLIIIIPLILSLDAGEKCWSGLVSSLIYNAYTDGGGVQNALGRKGGEI